MVEAEPQKESDKENITNSPVSSLLPLHLPRDYINVCKRVTVLMAPPLNIFANY
ncbi:hypothetical protein F2Q70_00019402 [Brassica cretica]|uniref:Uncharacterized protein n=1 Tax=Brassica cretica TaxID=69181 RepID=A0A8S9GQQ4_BRACR|nr:hypothetical protein F2Q70_00019402 [Brassica cretica]